ncbi:MAG: hypothetical protein NTX50_29235 [Candidatus Sumerlaeota bacterium]|nr:hypothetical protein [Candidatus Sumerlaeota bacterium]
MIRVVFLLPMLVFALMPIYSSSEESIAERCRQILCNLQTTASCEVAFTDSQDAASLSRHLLPLALQMPESSSKQLVLERVERFMIEHPYNPKYPARSESKDLMEMLIKESLVLGKNLEAPCQLINLFRLESLDARATTIREGILKLDRRTVADRSYLVALYCILPSTTKESAITLINEIRAAGVTKNTRQNLIIDALLTRYGDKEAEARVIHTLGDNHTSRMNLAMNVDPYELRYIISLAPTDTIKKFLAEGLRSEKLIYFANIQLPQREFFARYIAYILRDDVQEFNKLLWPNHITEEKLDELELWCAKNWGVVYPKEKRRPVPGVIAVGISRTGY